MTKKDLVRAIAEEMGLSQTAVKEVVQKTLDHMTDTLVAQRRMELRNFGVFEIKSRGPRRARNPKTGESVDVAAKYVVTFRPGREMEARVRNMEKAERLDAARRGVVPEVERPRRKKPPRPDPPPAVAAAG